MINLDDLTIETWPSVKQGGQIAGIPRGVKITHNPSGLTAISSDARSQHRNKNIAMDMIIGGLTSPHFNY